ncbi:MAG: aminoacyl-tRNA deacylase [Deltaproteobacteria bacterium]|nr:aminoacyl-tRNA deacylase [Deltaproteobacteria bacterium]
MNRGRPGKSTLNNWKQKPCGSPLKKRRKHKRGFLADKPDIPVTPAVRFLRERKIDFKPRFYTYEEHGGTHLAAEMLKIPEHSIIKTLVLKADSGQPFIVLQHGDCQVSTKELARQIGVKRINPCGEGEAQKHTGYQVGGISPFGTRKTLPVYAEKSIFSLDRLVINGGKRGFLIEISPGDLSRTLPLKKVEAALKK